MIEKVRLQRAWWESHLLERDVVLPVPPAGDRVAWRRLTELPGTLEIVRPDNDQWPTTPATSWLRTMRDGNRDEYEARVFTRHALLTRAVVRACVAPEPEALDQVVDYVVAWCEQSSWCWPAHDDSHHRGRHLPDVDRPYLDLGAGEVAAQLAWTIYVLGDALEERAPGLRQRVELEVRRRIFDPFEQREDWPWLHHIHNWLPWICGNVATASLVLEPDQARRARLVARAVVGLDRYLDALPDDGAIDEGFSYWWNGAGRMLEAFELLKFATGGDFVEWQEFPKSQETVRFPLRMHLGGDWFVNIADGSARPVGDLAWPSLHRAALALGQTDVAGFAAARQREPLGSAPAHLGRVLLELVQQSDNEPRERSGDPRELQTWLPSVQVGIARENTAGAGLTLVTKGGHNDENHNHNDVGSFIVACNGVPVIVDAGRPTYTAQTFSPQRYEIWTMQSDWHNVPAPAGTAQPPGKEIAAQEVRWNTTPGGARFEAELRDAYPEAPLETWRRTVELDRTPAQVRVSDEWRFTADPPRTSHTMLLIAGEIEAISELDYTIEALEGAGKLRLTSSHPMSVGAHTLEDPMLTDVWGPELHRVVVDLGVSKSGRASVAVSMLEENRR